MGKSHTKGRQLEEAVKSIEALILQSDDSLAQTDFQLEPNKIINSAGTRHEIDLFVTVSRAGGYDSTFVFECKNRQKATGKNDIIIFTEIIEATSAQKGYFIAASFTKDAVAQANKNPRIELVRMRREFEWLSESFGFNVTVHTIDRLSVQLKERGKPLPDCALFADVSSLRYKLGNEAGPFYDYVEKTVNAEIREARAINNSKFKLAGSHPQRLNFQLCYTEVGDLVINGHDIDQISFYADYTVLTDKCIVQSKFEVEKRGRIITYVPESMPGLQTALSIKCIQLIK